MVLITKGGLQCPKCAEVHNTVLSGTDRCFGADYVDKRQEIASTQLRSHISLERKNLSVLRRFVTPITTDFEGAAFN